LVLDTDGSSEVVIASLDVAPLQSHRSLHNPRDKGTFIPLLAGHSVGTSETGNVSSMAFPFSPFGDSEIKNMLVQWGLNSSYDPPKLNRAIA
jgi:hypothetical protein